MQFRKLAAAAGSALMAGMALAAPALAAISNVNEISSMPSVSDGTVMFPLLVIGAEGHAQDVAAAANLGTWLAGYAGEEKSSTTTGTTATATGGAALSSGGTRLYMGDKLNTARSTLTKTDLPNVLASLTHTNDAGTEIKYDQFIELTSTVSAFDHGDSGSGMEDAAPYINITSSAPTTSSYMYNLVANFQGAGINVTHADTRNTDLTLFGTTWTIGATSTSTSLVLYGAGEEVTLNAGEEATFTIGGEEHTISLHTVTEVSGSDNDKTYISIDGGSQRDINQQVLKTINGIDVYAKTVIYTSKTGDVSSATFKMGADKLTLGNGNKAKQGTSDTNIKGTLCTVTAGSGGEITKLQVSIAAPKASENFILEGEEFLDPVFGTVRLSFDSLSIPIGDDDRVSVTVGVSTDYNSVLFEDKNGNEVDTDWAKDTDNANSGTTSFGLNSTEGRIIVVEGELIRDQEYFVSNAGGFGHIFQVSNIDDNASTCTASEGIEITDIVTQQAYDFVYETGSCNNDTINIDGVAFHAYNPGGTDDVNITWKTGTRTTEFETQPTADVAIGAGTVGSHQSIWPGIEIAGEKSAWVHFTDPVTLTLTDGVAQTWLLPTGLLSLFAQSNTDVSNITYTLGSNTIATATTATVWANTTNTSAFQVGRQYYNLSWSVFTGTAASVDVTLRLAASSTGGTPYVDQAALLIKEGKNDNDQYETIIVQPGDDSAGAGVPSAPTSSGATNVKWWAPTTLGSDSTLSHSMDLWGTHIVRDTDTDSALVISIPKSQVFANAFFLEAEGTVSQGTSSSGTYVEAVPVTGDIAVLDTEITEAQKSGNDLIVVGGPCVNIVAADLLGLEGYTCGADSTIEEDTAIVKVFADKYAEGKVAVLVAGWEKEHTDIAARAIQTGKLADNEVASVTITGTSLSSLTIE